MKKGAAMYKKYAIQGARWSVHYLRFAYREKDGTLKTSRSIELHQTLAAY